MSAELDTTAVVGMEEYCLDTVSRFIKEGASLGISNSGGAVLNLAAMIAVSLSGKLDTSKGVVLSAQAFEEIQQKHLIKEYVKTGEQIEIRHFLAACPHA